MERACQREAIRVERSMLMMFILVQTRNGIAEKVETSRNYKELWEKTAWEAREKGHYPASSEWTIWNSKGEEIINFTGYYIKLRNAQIVEKDGIYYMADSFGKDILPGMHFSTFREARRKLVELQLEIGIRETKEPAAKQV